MISKNKRLSRSEIEYVLKKGDRTGNSYFSIKWKNGKQDKSRFAVVVSTKIAPRAVDRNRIRRQIFEAIRQTEEPEKPLDIVLIAKKTVQDLEFSALQALISQILKTLHEESH